MAHALKSLELLEGFQQSISKSQVGGACRRVGDRAQFSDWLMMREPGGVTGVNFISPYRKPYILLT